MNEVLVLGSGAWGTSLANLLADNTKKIIYLWSFEKEVANTINSKFINQKYLPSKKLNRNIRASSFSNPLELNHFKKNSTILQRKGKWNWALLSFPFADVWPIP